jgi:hypothetical protein
MLALLLAQPLLSSFGIVKTILFTALLFLAPPEEASDAQQILKVVSYDRNLNARTADGLRLLILFAPDVEASKNAAAAFQKDVEALTRERSELAPAAAEMLPFASAEELYRALVTRKTSALYVAEGFGAVLPEVVRAAEDAGVMTLAGDPQDVERGLSAGILHQGDARKVVVNMGAAERAGVDLDPAVRQVAQRAGGGASEPERRSLTETLSRYRDAIEQKDMAALRSLWPTLSDDEAKKVEGSMAAVRSQQVFLALLRIESQGARFKARVRRSDHLVTREGQKLVSGRLIEIVFTRSGDGAWIIDSMGSV